MSEGHTYGAQDTEHTPPCTGHCLGNLKHISCHSPKQAQHWVLFAPSLEKPEAEALGTTTWPWCPSLVMDFPLLGSHLTMVVGSWHGSGWEPALCLL